MYNVYEMKVNSTLLPGRQAGRREESKFVSAKSRRATDRPPTLTVLGGIPDITFGGSQIAIGDSQFPNTRP